MAQITTLNQIITWFKQYTEQHPVLKDFGYGATDAIGTTRAMSYPYLWASSTNSNPITISNHVVQPEFEFLIMVVDAISDQVQPTAENGWAATNEQDVLSDTYQILQDFVAWLNSSWRATGITINTSLTAQPVYDTTPDRVSGWAVTISLRIPYSMCVSGIDVNLPNISSNLTAGNAVSSSYALTASYALNGTANVSQSIITASAAGPVITFRRGNGTTFPVTVNSVRNAETASLASFAPTPPVNDSSNRIATTAFIATQVGGIDAASIPFTPTGSITAPTVEAAINQVNTQKISNTGGTLSGYLNLPASPILPAQAANKLYVDSAINSAVIKSAQVTFSPQGNISASNVQGVLAELDSEKVAKAGDVMSGYLTLVGNPTDALHATPRQYVDGEIAERFALSPIVNSGSAGRAPILDGMGLLDMSTIPNTVVKSVNSILPDTSGNVVVTLTSTLTGTLAAIPTSASNGTMYVVSGDSTPSNNGLTYIYVDPTWQPVASLDTAFYDTRYLSLNGGTLSGSLYVPAAPVGGAHVTNKYYVDTRIASASYAATAITYDATTTISSSNVQTAIAELDAEKLSRDGGTMTGYVTLAGDPINPLHAATMQYVDDSIANQTLSLDDLIDVSAATPVTNDLLYFDGLTWKNGNPPNRAFNVTSNPVGLVTATNVQTAIAQLSALVSTSSIELPELWSHPATLTGSQYTVKENHNGLLVGPVSFTNNIDIQTGATLVIL